MKFNIFAPGLLICFLAFAVYCGQSSAIQWDAFDNSTAALGNCTDEACELPDCHCSETITPGGLDSKSIPQFVLISFDDAVTVTNFPVYEEFSTYTNPNGCPIKMTFYISHENTNYTLVNALYTLGHEIASHSVSLEPDVENYWRNMSTSQWTKEITGVKTMFNEFALVPDEDVTGFRAPFLEVGGNQMYEALEQENFKYDSSWPTQLYTTWYTSLMGGDPLGVLYPYTLDYLSIQEQSVGTKPTDSFPGLWLNPMTDLQDLRGVACSYLDQCQAEGDALDTSADAVFSMLSDNFQRHYFGSRAPFGLYTRESWFSGDEDAAAAHKDGFVQFLEQVSLLSDVYFITVSDAVDWVKNPVDLDSIDDFDNIHCSSSLPQSQCTENTDCYYAEPLPIDQKEVYMNICGSSADCPPYYPWVDDPTGQTNAMG